MTTLADRMEANLRSDVEDDETVSEEAIARVRRICDDIEEIVGDARIAAYAIGDGAAALVLNPADSNRSVIWEVWKNGRLHMTRPVDDNYKYSLSTRHTVRENAAWSMGKTT